MICRVRAPKRKTKMFKHFQTKSIGFETSIKKSKYDLSSKEILILGAGGVVPSLIYALKKMNVSKIILSNRTKHKAESLKNFFDGLTIIDWGKITQFDMIINATSLGLKKKDEINIEVKN